MTKLSRPRTKVEIARKVAHKMSVVYGTGLRCLVE